MTLTFDEKPIRSWTTKHPANAAAWWARLESPTEKQLFGQIVFADRPGPGAPLRAATPDQVERIIAFVLESDALRVIVSDEISAEIARVTDQIRVETSVRLQAVVDKPEPPAKAPVPPAKPEPPKTAPAKKPAPPKAEPAKKPEPPKPDKAGKPGKAAKPEKADKDGKPARGRKKA